MQIMEPNYDLYLTGSCIGDADPTAVIDGLASLFNLDPGNAAKLLDGQARRIKRGCDKATALRYRSALNELGAEVRLARHTTEAPPSPESPPQDADYRPVIDGTQADSWSLAPVGTRLSDPQAAPASNLSIPNFEIAPAGELIPTLQNEDPVVTPSTEHLSLCDDARQ